MKLRNLFYLLLVVCPFSFAQDGKAHIYAYNLLDQFHWSIAEARELSDQLIDVNISVAPPSPHGATLISEYVELFYPNANIVYLRATYESGGSKELLDSVSFRDCDTFEIGECYIGYSVEDVTEVFGPPDNIYNLDTEYRYMVPIGDAGSSPLIFALKDGEVVETTVHSYID